MTSHTSGVAMNFDQSRAKNFGSSTSVHLIHSSVRAYLLFTGFAYLMTDIETVAPGNDSSNVRIYGECETRLAKSCIHYLNLEEIARFPPFEQYDHDRLSFVSYAVTSWFLHAMKAEALGVSQSYIAQEFSSSGQAWNPWLAVYQELHDADLPDFRQGSELILVASATNLSTTVRMLLSNGVSIDVVDTGGNRPLHLAAREGCEEVLGILLDAGANVEAKNLAQKGALDLAAENGHNNIVARLLKSAAHRPMPTKVNDEGKMANETIDDAWHPSNLSTKSKKSKKGKKTEEPMLGNDIEVLKAEADKTVEVLGPINNDNGGKPPTIELSDIPDSQGKRVEKGKKGKKTKQPMLGNDIDECQAERDEMVEMLSPTNDKKEGEETLQELVDLAESWIRREEETRERVKQPMPNDYQDKSTIEGDEIVEVITDHSNEGEMADQKSGSSANRRRRAEGVEGLMIQQSMRGDVDDEFKTAGDEVVEIITENSSEGEPPDRETDHAVDRKRMRTHPKMEGDDHVTMSSEVSDEEERADQIDFDANRRRRRMERANRAKQPRLSDFRNVLMAEGESAEVAHTADAMDVPMVEDESVEGAYTIDSDSSARNRRRRRAMAKAAARVERVYKQLLLEFSETPMTTVELPYPTESSEDDHEPRYTRRINLGGGSKGKKSRRERSREREEVPRAGAERYFRFNADSSSTVDETAIRSESKTANVRRKRSKRQSEKQPRSHGPVSSDDDGAQRRRSQVEALEKGGRVLGCPGEGRGSELHWAAEPPLSVQDLSVQRMNEMERALTPQLHPSMGARARNDS